MSATAGLAATPCLGASAAPGTAAASATDPDRAVLSAAASASRQAAAPSHGASAAGTAAASAPAVSTPPPLATLEQAKAVKPFDVIDVLFSATQWHTAVVQRVDQVRHLRRCPRPCPLRCPRPCPLRRRRARGAIRSAQIGLAQIGLRYILLVHDCRLSATRYKALLLNWGWTCVCLEPRHSWTEGKMITTETRLGSDPSRFGRPSSERS